MLHQCEQYSKHFIRLVSSMIESVIASMTTSMDLAKSFVEEQSIGGEGGDDQQQFQGIDALAQIIQISTKKALLLRRQFDI